MSTASVAEAALRLSTYRNALNDAASTADRAMFTNDAGRAKALKDLIALVDEVVVGLHPFAFYQDEGYEQLLGLSQAVAYARGGDAESAGRLLVELYRPASEEAA